MESCTKILGYDIYFPVGKKPFPAQLAVISKVLQALSKKQNALLESPTGTGKTLALLTSVLSWQKKHKKNLIEKENSLNNEIQPTTTTTTTTTTTPPATPTTTTTTKTKSTKINKSNAPNEERNEIQKKAGKFQIFYCSRTHSQLQQVISELKSCHESYLEPGFIMSLLSSKSHLCINDDALERSKVNGNIQREKLDELCRSLIGKKSEEETNHQRCPYYRMFPTSTEPFINSKVWDIEDAHHLGKFGMCCPYFISTQLSEVADIVFAPYIYLIDPIIRFASKIDLTDSIIVIDEAHNIEETCREATSFESSSHSFNKSIQNLDILKNLHPQCKIPAQGLLEFIGNINNWMKKCNEILESIGYEQDNRVWTGEEALILFETELFLTNDTLNIYMSYYSTILEFANDETNTKWSELDIANDNYLNNTYFDFENNNDNDNDYDYDNDNNNDNNIEKKRTKIQYYFRHLCLKLNNNIKKLLIVLQYMMTKDTDNFKSYRVVVQKSRDIKTQKIDFNLHIWCLSAHIAFRDISSQCHSIILTSGTLSPLESFEKELGVDFPIRVEAQHVIDTSSQVYVTAVSTYENNLLMSTYLNQSNLFYMDTIGRCIFTLMKMTQDGVLVFLPSYSFLDKLYERWSNTNFLREFDNPDYYTDTYKGTTLFFEPKESTKLDQILNEYSNCIDNGKQAIFFAVCRGKVSEGIDFSDHYARLVLIVGIPFPNFSSIQVKLKRSYQDELTLKYPDEKYLTGDEWYNQQAFRAINQAIGRCIRHIKDFGAIVLCDNRYQKNQYQQKLSRWVRSNIMNINRVEDILLPLRLFYSENKIKFADHIKQLIESKRPPQIETSPKPQINSNITKKKRKKNQVIYEIEEEIDVVKKKNIDNDQFTLSQVYRRYTSKTSNNSKSSLQLSPIKIQLKECMIQWQWMIQSYDNSLFSINNIQQRLLEEIPFQLKYLQNNMGSTNNERKKLDIIDDINDNHSLIENSNDDYSNNNNSNNKYYAVSIFNWCWPNPPFSNCNNDSHNNGNCTNSSLCICQLKVVEIWNSTDGVVYRLLQCPKDVFDSTNITSDIILAAKIIATTNETSELIGKSYLNWKIIQDLFSTPNFSTNQRNKITTTSLSTTVNSSLVLSSSSTSTTSISTTSISISMLTNENSNISNITILEDSPQILSEVISLDSNLDDIQLEVNVTGELYSNQNNLNIKHENNLNNRKHNNQKYNGNVKKNNVSFYNIDAADDDDDDFITIEKNRRKDRITYSNNSNSNNNIQNHDHINNHNNHNNNSKKKGKKY